MQTIGLKTELLTRLCETGRKLDTATDPAEMKALLGQRRVLTAELESYAPPSLRIFRPA
jgi:hypothetical protein